MAKKNKKSSIVKIDFSGVESRQKLPEDDYLVRLDEVNQTESNAGNDQLEFIFKVKEGKFEDSSLHFYCPLSENSLWKLHGLLTAMGVDVPDDEMDLDTEELVGNELMAVVTHEVFEGVKRSKMTDFYAVETKDEPKKSKKKDEEDEPKGKKKSSDEDEDEMTPAQKRKARRDARKEKKGGSSKDEDDTGDDEDEKPAKKDKDKKSKKKPKLTSDEVQEMDEDDLQGVIDTYELDTDLDDYKTLRKKAAAVIDALEAGDYIDDDE